MRTFVKAMNITEFYLNYVGCKAPEEEAGLVEVIGFI